MSHRLNFSATSNSPTISPPHAGGIAFYSVMVGCLLTLAVAGLLAL